MARLLCTRSVPCDLVWLPICVRACVLELGVRTSPEHGGSWFPPPEAADSTYSQGPGNRRVGEGVGWEQCRKRIGTSERGNPPVGSADVDGGARPSLLGSLWRGGFQVLCHGFLGRDCFRSLEGIVGCRVSGESVRYGFGVTPIGGLQLVQIYLSELFCFLLQGWQPPRDGMSNEAPPVVRVLGEN